MSHPIRTIGEEWRNTGVYLTNAMYEGGSSKNARKELTNEQLWAMLEQIRIESFENYQTISDEMGW